MDSFLLTLVAGIVVVVVGLILEYRTKWFARALESAHGRRDSTRRAILPGKVLGQDSSMDTQAVIRDYRAKKLAVSTPEIVTEESSTIVPSVVEYKKDPLPGEIFEQIEKAGILNKDMAARYVGLKVEWLLTIDNLYRVKGDIYDVALVYGLPLPMVLCRVDFSKYPEFKTVRLKSQVWVTGEIYEVSLTYIALKGCAFRFV